MQDVCVRRGRKVLGKHVTSCLHDTPVPALNPFPVDIHRIVMYDHFIHEPILAYTVTSSILTAAQSTVRFGVPLKLGAARNSQALNPMNVTGVIAS